jgi:hypothetical protein
MDVVMLPVLSVGGRWVGGRDTDRHGHGACAGSCDRESRVQTPSLPMCTRHSTSTSGSPSSAVSAGGWVPARAPAIGVLDEEGAHMRTVGWFWFKPHCLQR